MKNKIEVKIKKKLIEAKTQKQITVAMHSVQEKEEIVMCKNQFGYTYREIMLIGRDAILEHHIEETIE